MKKQVVWASVILSVLLAGCGISHGPETISHGMTATQVKKEVYDRIRSWRTVSESITEVAYRKHTKRQVFHVQLVSQDKPAAFSLKVSPSSGTPYQVIDNGLNTIVYQSGAKYYSVLTADPVSWTEFRILGTDLPKVIQDSKAISVVVNPKEVVLKMLSPVASGITAKTTLWFNLTTNTPSRWVATWDGGTLQETPSHVVLNSQLKSSAFSFTPPSGVVPEAALTAQGTELNMVRSQVSFPIVLPPASMELVLNAVDMGTEGPNRVALLTYQTSSGNPVVITESKAGVFKPPSGISFVTESVGLLQVRIGTMPAGGEMAVLTLNKTLVVVQGPSSVVDGLINTWGSSAVASSSTSSSIAP